MGAGLPGAADGGDSGGAGPVYGAVRHVCHLAHDGQKLRCGGAGGGSLRFWSGGNPNGYRQHAGDHRTVCAIAHGVSGGSDGRGVLY